MMVAAEKIAAMTEPGKAGSLKLCESIIDGGGLICLPGAH
jgi:hypothetical protein